MPARIRRAALAVLAVAASLSVGRSLTAQRTWFVGGPGGFVTIPSAIAVASPGDVVVVRSGIYDQGFTVDKGVTLIGENAVLTRQGLLPASLLVHDLPVDETFVMRGFAADAASISDIAIEVREFAGAVSLQELSQNGLMIWSVGAVNANRVHIESAVLRVASLDSSGVVLENVVLDPVTIGLNVNGGRVVLSRSGANGGSFFGGLPAIQIGSGELWVTRSNVQANGPTAPAVFANGGTLRLDSTAILSASVAPVVGAATPVFSDFTSLDADVVGQTLFVDNHGIAGEGFVTVLGLSGSELVTPIGWTWLDPSSIGIVTAGVFPGSRTSSVSAALPPLPTGLTVAIQTVTFGPAGVGLSTPTLVTQP